MPQSYTNDPGRLSGSRCGAPSFMRTHMIINEVALPPTVPTTTPPAVDADALVPGAGPQVGALMGGMKGRRIEFDTLLSDRIGSEAT